MAALEAIWHALADPVVAFGHFSYFLLIVSMLMRRMVWLRTLAVASGLTKIVFTAPSLRSIWSASSGKASSFWSTSASFS